VKKEEEEEKYPRPGDLLQVDIRGRKLGARVVTLPFYRGGTTKQTSS
jgi:glycine cleavage system aminomethyltransferase T